MLYLITGTLGTGKTSMVVDMILNNKDGLFKMEAEDGTKIDRPLYFCHIDGLDKRKFKAHELTEEQLQSAPLNEVVPEGSVVIVDEADYTYPVRSSAQKPPPYIQTLKELRHSGFTLILMTQHPTMIDKYIRNIVVRHIHLERKVVGTYKYEFYRCEESLSPQALAGTTKSFYKPPKEAFKYYKSASKHIKFKKKLPTVFWVVFFLIAVLLYFGVPWFGRIYEKTNPSAKKEDVVQVADSQPVQPSAPVEAELVDLVDVPPPASPSALPEAAASVPEFSEAYYRPRVEGMPETAPIYDGIRAVSRMESVAACIKGRKGCDCYTDFGTKVSIKPETCRDWAENGLPFNPYRREGVGMAEGQNARISQPEANTGEGGVYVMGGKDKLTLLPDYSKGPSAQ